MLEAPGDVRLEGREQVIQYSLSWFNAFPDARITVRDQHEAGEWVTQEATFSGTHENTLAGPTGEIPPTHRSLNGRVVALFQVQDGQIVRQHIYFDQMQVLTQLGLMQEAGAL